MIFSNSLNKVVLRMKTYSFRFQSRGQYNCTKQYVVLTMS